MQIQRNLQSVIIERIQAHKKAIILYGARQVGKTTLANAIIQELGLKTLSINADEQRFIDVLSSRDGRQLSQLVAGYDCLFVDEAQRVPEIGINLKILIDEHPDLLLVVTGSSSLEVSQHVGEPLTGRKWTFQLYPIAQLELAKTLTPFELNEQLEERLVWGSYPDIFNLATTELKEAYLRELVDDYLLKDILQIANLKRGDKLFDLLRLLAFQIGSTVSINELAQQLGLGHSTVQYYLELLEKCFVIYPLSGFSRNLRKEISKSNKYYFYDLGIRNTLINNLSPISLRNDQGALWENFIIIERLKRNQYLQNWYPNYFWRTYTGAEIDYVEDQQGSLSGYEIKYNKKAKAREPKSWRETYAEATWHCVNASNWQDFVSQ